MPERTEHFREITSSGVIPTPSGAGALLLHAEEGRDAFVVLSVFRPADKARLTAVVTFEGCMQSVFGYPNDEAYWRDPRGAVGDSPGYGFFEVVNSSWPQRLISYNQHAFPDRTPAHYQQQRHFFIGSHDASAEFLAASMTIELSTHTHTEAAAQTLQRLSWTP